MWRIAFGTPKEIGQCPTVRQRTLRKTGKNKTKAFKVYILWRMKRIIIGEITDKRRGIQKCEGRKRSDNSENVGRNKMVEKILKRDGLL